MSAQRKQISFVDAFGSLLDFSNDSLASKLPPMPTHKFGVKQHFTSVAGRLNRAVSDAHYDQAAKQKKSDRTK